MDVGRYLRLKGGHRDLNWRLRRGGEGRENNVMFESCYCLNPKLGL